MTKLHTETPPLTSQVPDQQTDLVERARAGDREAFNDLIRLHRAKAHGWANSLVKDSFMAEDIVQDALIKAFLRLGTLIETEKFLPWLRQIVRNQAYMKLRRGGPYRKEEPVSGLMLDNPVDQNNASTDWSNVDHILFQLTHSVSKKADLETPEEHMVRLDVMENIRFLLHCLSQRERSIFEAHFFQELPPIEIAKLFQTSTANVYNTLSRSRVKVRRERIRVSIKDYTQKRAENGLPSRKKLPPPPKL